MPEVSAASASLFRSSPSLLPVLVPACHAERDQNITQQHHQLSERSSTIMSRHVAAVASR